MANLAGPKRPSEPRHHVVARHPSGLVHEKEPTRHPFSVPGGALPSRYAAVVRKVGVAAVLPWYDAAQRPLPWRTEEASPWSILVSEVMLQQTQVDRVVPLWTVWMARWPTPAALAAASPGDVLRAWGRLGYPRRALSLHRAAERITTDHGGHVPDTLDALRALPGIGAYTARAVLSFAYHQRHPVVDTNIRRVLARALRGLPRAARPSESRDQALMASVLPDDPVEAARFNLAVMELGATVCTARTPACPACPLRPHCAWLAAGCPEPDTPAPRRQAPFPGSDRAARGAILQTLRTHDGPVPRITLTDVWADGVQRERALASLLRDGLAVATPDGITLPGG